MEHIKTIVIPDPPTKYIVKSKTKIDPKTGKLKADTHYLTANLFYADKIHYHLKSKIVKFSKDYLFIFFQGLPKLEKMKINVIYSRPDDNFDLDNKAYYWTKIALDIFKTPSSRQLLNAHKKGNDIVTINCLPDDTVKYLDEINMKYVKGEHSLVFEIYGRKMDEQKKMFP